MIFITFKRGKPIGPAVEKDCPFCGSKFVTKEYPYIKYCSLKCYSYAKKRMQKGNF